MRAIQWNILGVFFILVDMWFIFQDRFYNTVCSMVEPFSQPVTAELVMCINGELLEPFIWILFPLGIVFFICGSIERKGREIESRNKSS